MHSPPFSLSWSGIPLRLLRFHFRDVQRPFPSRPNAGNPRLDTSKLMCRVSYLAGSLKLDFLIGIKPLTPRHQNTSLKSACVFIERGRDTTTTDDDAVVVVVVVVVHVVAKPRQKSSSRFFGPRCVARENTAFTTTQTTLLETRL